MFDRTAWLVVTCGGLGALKPGPGTWGTVGGIALAAGVVAAFPAEITQSAALATACLLACVLNVALGGWCERRFGGKDPQAVVIDEVAGVLLTFLIAPRGENVWLWLAASFVAFRVFDISKPPPASQLEKLSRGWGVLCDDLAAGVYAGLTLRVIGYFLGAP